MDILLGSHLDDLPFDELDPPLIEEAEIEEPVELFSRPQMLPRFVKLDRRHCALAFRFCGYDSASAITSSWTRLRFCSFSRNSRPGFLTLTRSHGRNSV